ncbi:DNA-directed RNA polymerase III subunit RPC10 [Microplitis mediator]|uniref:DNA-directed RNA polymerase III subunit RPC10 n=1 Tax=Microplitis demolitor TaxID=69319 RepID=UPI0004CD2F5A|nr:DNA-directed RNA polymerase III subunit RPC10 [Microplitis demolitor]XP_057328281.1 DNA-directed RNA polymerase III subunit RPC10 [Microplitis mediator]
MLLFCPTCGNALLIEEASQMRLECPTCPYVFNVNRKIVTRNYPLLKEVDSVLGGEEAWKNVDATDITCPECSHPRAYFRQLQTRSADEPMTIFYRCCNPDCSFNWKD